MSLLNYTTRIDADKTAHEIAKCLSLHGASSILTDYGPKGYISALSFKIKVGDKPMGFRLPCDFQPVLEVLKNDSKVPRAHKDESQAVRTAWRIVKDWVEAQMALVDTKMVRTEEVFLPYAIMKNGQTLAEHMQANPEFLLGDGKN